jgi:hypothetical protein
MNIRSKQMTKKSIWSIDALYVEKRLRKRPSPVMNVMNSITTAVLKDITIRNQQNRSEHSLYL